MQYYINENVISRYSLSYIVKLADVLETYKTILLLRKPKDLSMLTTYSYC